MTLTWYITIMVQLSIADSSISSGDESEDFEEGNYDFSDDDYDIDEKVTRKSQKSRMQDNRKSKELLHSKRKSAGKTKAPGVRPKIHKQKSVYTSESDDNNDEPDGSLKLLTNTISKFNKESTEKDGSFVSNANRVVNKKMLRYHKKLQLSLTAKLDSLAAKSSEGQST